MYYAPDALPDEALHPHSFELGSLPGCARRRARAGSAGGGSFAVALHEGGPRNGILTAIEDFLEGRDDLVFVDVPAIFGLGVIYIARGALRRAA